LITALKKRNDKGIKAITALKATALKRRKK
jgi:hypothetical protein